MTGETLGYIGLVVGGVGILASIGLYFLGRRDGKRAERRAIEREHTVHENQKREIVQGIAQQKVEPAIYALKWFESSDLKKELDRLGYDYKWSDKESLQDYLDKKWERVKNASQAYIEARDGLSLIMRKKNVE